MARRGQTLVHLCHPFPFLAPYRKGPATHHRPPRPPLRKSLLVRKRHQGLCLLASCLHLAAEPMDPHRTLQRIRQTVRVKKLVRQGEGLTASLQGLVRIAQHPEGPGDQEAVHPRIQSVAERMRARRLTIIEGAPLLQVEAGQRQFAEVEQWDAQRTMRLDEEGRLIDVLGQCETLLSHLARGPERPPLPI